MKSRAAAAAPRREAVHTTATVGAPQATAIGTPVARTQIFPRPEFPSAAAGTTTLTLDPPAEPSLLINRPPAPAPTAQRADHPDRAFAVGQVVCWQLAVVAVGVATTGSRTSIVLTSLASLSLVLLTAVRIRGMWLYRWLGIGLLFAVRRRQLDLGTDAGLDLAGLFRGRTTAGAVVVRDQPYGTLYRPEGASVALRVDAESRFELLTRLPELADAADEQPVPVTVQLVLHCGVKQNQPARAWIAIRAIRTPEICTNEQLGQILANTVRRPGRDCEADGASGGAASAGPGSRSRIKSLPRFSTRVCGWGREVQHESALRDREVQHPSGWVTFQDSRGCGERPDRRHPGRSTRPG